MRCDTVNCVELCCCEPLCAVLCCAIAMSRCGVTPSLISTARRSMAQILPVAKSTGHKHKTHPYLTKMIATTPFTPKFNVDWQYFFHRTGGRSSSKQLNIE